MTEPATWAANIGHTILTSYCCTLCTALPLIVAVGVLQSYQIPIERPIRYELYLCSIQIQPQGDCICTCTVQSLLHRVAVHTLRSYTLLLHLSSNVGGTNPVLPALMYAYVKAVQ